MVRWRSGNPWFPLGNDCCEIIASSSRDQHIQWLSGIVSCWVSFPTYSAWSKLSRCSAFCEIIWVCTTVISIPRRLFYWEKWENHEGPCWDTYSVPLFKCLTLANQGNLLVGHRKKTHILADMEMLT